MTELLRANQLIDLFFKDSHTCFVLLDIDFNFIRVNEAYATVCGQTVDFFPGKNHFELYPSDVEDIFKSVRASKQAFSITARPFSFPDHPEWGVTYWDWLLEPILDQQGEIEFFVFSLIDVSSRVKAENQRDRFFSLSADMLAIADARGYFTDLSPAWTKVLGYSSEELKAKPFVDFVHQDDRESTLKESARLIEDPEATLDFVNRYQTKNGDYRWLCWNAVGSQDGNQIYAVAHDITELKLKEAALENHKLELEKQVNDRTSALTASQSRLNFLLQSSPAVIYTCKCEGDFGATFISENVRTIFGFEPASFLTDSGFWVNNIHPDDKQHVLDGLGNLFKYGHHTHEYRFRRGNGEYIWVLDELRLVKDDKENNVEIIGYWADISDRKKVEKDVVLARDMAVKANQYKSDFLSRMSHELRTPMNAILGFAQLLDMNSNDQMQKQQLDEISKAGGHLLDLINDVLDLSKIEAGNIEISMENVRLADVLNEILSIIEPVAVSRNIYIDKQALLDGSHVLNVDYTRFKQVLINLLSNAVKYNVDGGGIKLDVKPRSNDILRISVSDTGKGLTNEQQKSLFMPFERLGAEATDIEGTGIGLVITKQLVEMMGGQIGYEINPDGGSIFWVDVIKGSDIKISDVADMDVSTVNHNLSAAKKILYVEDNPANMKLVKDIVRMTNHQLIEAVTGPLGIEAALSYSPDLILLDINLPELDGFEVFQRLSNEPSVCSVPVVALSANAMKKEIDRAFELGFKQYITKPINVKELLSIIESLI